ncbi:hypothetical protein C8R45DRAFT_1131783 [Mycena sanguinolenta]|nr:hypothetical protein C8R45DRAFT_1131783 [Mycena sanguinolenta]
MDEISKRVTSVTRAITFCHHDHVLGIATTERYLQWLQHGLDYFQKLVLALSPDFRTICSDDGPQPFEMYVCEYDTWRRRLPEEELEKAPILKVYNFSWEEDPDANTKFFFATRCVPAPDDSITETSPSTAHETDVDRKRRDELIELIERRNNFSVDKSRLRFEAIKDVHPYYDSLGTRYQ